MAKEAIAMARTSNVFARVEPEIKEKARSDLRGIYEYIAIELLSGVLFTGRFAEHSEYCANYVWWQRCAQAFE